MNIKKKNEITVVKKSFIKFVDQKPNSLIRKSYNKQTLDMIVKQYKIDRLVKRFIKKLKRSL